MEAKGKDISEELLDKMEDCQTAEELITLARENGIELTKAEADELFEEIGSIDDEALAGVAGGISRAGLRQKQWERRMRLERILAEQRKRQSTSPAAPSVPDDGGEIVGESE